MPKSLSILLGLLLLGAAPASAAEGQAQAAKDCPVEVIKLDANPAT